jgi:ATP-dependent helicase/nuclease subunit B
MTGGRGLYTIPPGVPFVDALAAGLLAQADDDPLTLADYTVLLPTRRACRALREAFLRQSGGRPLLLPRMRPVGDVDPDDLGLGEGPGLELLDLPPAIAEPRRLLLLARQILMREKAAGTAMTHDHAVRLARELARLLDQVQTERVGFDALASLAPRELAEHWEETLRFLHIVTAYWPDILAAEGCLDPADRRNWLLEGLARAWTDDPPDTPVVAAGSTGSIPATADLLAAVAGLPRGAVVLPGLDRGLDAESWAAVGEDQTHPQYGLLQLLDRFGAAREDVADWPVAGDVSRQSPETRAALTAEALRPAETTDAWRGLDRISATAIEAVTRIDCPGEKEEAEIVALLLREALEEPGRTAALVTPDRRLGRRVAGALQRWGIEIDDSAGQPLDETAPGVFLRHVARAAAEALAPVSLLAACKHPLAAAGRNPAAFRRDIRRLERWVLRGPRPAGGIEGLRAALAEARNAEHGGIPPDAAAAVEDAIAALAAAFAPLTECLANETASLESLLDAHLAAAEALAATDTDPGAQRLWAGEAGETLADFVGALRHAVDVLPEVPAAGYPDLLDALMAGAVARPRHGLHPRLHIWGPLEARLQQADRVILGGLNEGVWPADPGPDPWMSRPMRSAFGLPLPERRIGLAAHDFAQLFCAREVVLTRAAKAEGAPTVPSRWLLRLEAVLRGAGLADAFASGDRWRGLQAGLDAVAAHCPAPAPKPKPRVADRPRRMSVTRIEAWMRDPYAIYAREILGLKRLEPLEADPGAADRGTIIHNALDAFLRRHPGDLPDDALERLLAAGREAFGVALARPAVRAFWWPRFERIARWFVEAEARRRPSIAASATELCGEYRFDAPGGPFTLTAKADRIDRMVDGSLTIIDYKTGAPPTDPQVHAGYAPQLPLEAVIAQAGGFAELPTAPVAELAYWRLSGGTPPGFIRAIRDDPAALAAAAAEGLARLVAAFDDPNTPYHPAPNPLRRVPLAYDDYAHLARHAEWSGGGDGE